MKKYVKLAAVLSAAALCSIGASATAYAATGWTQETGEWVYYDKDGYKASDEWRKSGNNWFWLDSDGYMVRSSLIEDDGNYYYVNSAGAMVSNEWREVQDDSGEDDAPDTRWYYLQSNGKAYKNNSDRTTFKTINGKKYAFDSEGRMLFGWVDESSERQTGDDAWKNGVYYLGAPSDGAMVQNSWARLEVVDDENEDNDFDETYWFYFSSNGKKQADTTKNINGRKYRFDEHGAAEYEWYAKPSTATGSTASASDGHLYYNLPEQCWLAKGWFKVVPSEEVDPEAYEDDTAYWFYAKSNGDLIKSQIKSIDGYRYAFNEVGEMLHGLYKMEMNGNDIISYEKIETDSDLPDENEVCSVYYFGDSPKEGVQKTGTATIDIDGEKYSYNFRKSGSDRGAGYNGIYKDSIYVHGRLLKADKDSKYEVISYQSKDYLVSSSGKIMKGRKNVKDADGKYYSTNSDGTVSYEGYDKQ